MIPPVVLQILTIMAMLTGMTLAPVMPIPPEPMPLAMTAGAVLDVPAEDLEMLACVIYQEAGGDACSDECRFMVGDVVLNRVADSRFPDTIEEVLTQRGQYGTFSKTGVVWPARAGNPGEAAAIERAYDTARRLLSGEHSELYGAGYIWQAEFIQGKDVIEVDGTYFGR